MLKNPFHITIPKVKEIAIILASNPSSVIITPTTLRYDKQHALTYEMEDRCNNAVENTFPLFNGGQPLDDLSESIGLYSADGFGGYEKFKHDLSMLVWYKTSQYFVFNPGSGFPTFSEINAMHDAGYRFINQGFATIRNDMNEEQVRQDAANFAQFTYSGWQDLNGGGGLFGGWGYKPLMIVKDSGNQIPSEHLWAWNESAWQNGAMLRAAGGDSEINLDNIVFKDLTGLYLTMSRTHGSLYSVDGFKNIVNTMMQNTTDHLFRRIWTHEVSNYGHPDPTDNLYNYDNFKEFFTWLQDNHANGSLWVTNPTSVLSYRAIAENIIINSVVDGNILKITYDESQIPEHIIDRFITFTVESDVEILSANLPGYVHKKKGEGTNKVTIDLKL